MLSFGRPSGSARSNGIVGICNRFDDWDGPYWLCGNVRLEMANVSNGGLRDSWSLDLGGARNRGYLTGLGGCSILAGWIRTQWT
jgi:hypothetical protein